MANHIIFGPLRKKIAHVQVSDETLIRFQECRAKLSVMTTAALLILIAEKLPANRELDEEFINERLGELEAEYGLKDVAVPAKPEGH